MRSEDTRGPFERRGLDPDIALAHGARFQSGAFRFDYRAPDGTLLFQKHRTEDKSKHWIEPKGARLRLQGLEEVPLFERKSDAALIITEGEFDRLSFLQVLADDLGHYVVSVPNGVAGKRSEGTIVIAEDNRFAYLWEGERLEPRVEQFDRIILATDGDEAGMLLRDELALRIGPARCWWLPFPAEHKDGNAVLQKWGPEGIRRILKAAKPIRPGMQMSMADVPPPPSITPISTGLTFLDRHVQIVRPELMVITGRPGCGKGVFARCLAAHLAEQHSWRTAFLSPEDPAYRMRRDLMRFYQRGKRGERPASELATEALKWVGNHFVYSALPEDEAIPIETVMAEMEAAVLQHNCQAFVLDPWNEISYVPSGDGESRDIERLLVALKQKMRRLNLLLIVVAHPRKPRQGEKIDLYTISGSANWFNKCDHGIILERMDPSSPRVEFVIEKCKDHETMGRPGSVWAELKREEFDYTWTQRPSDEELKEGRNWRRRDAALEAMQGGIEEQLEDPMFYSGYGVMT
jgi:twinkle protein